MGLFLLVYICFISLVFLGVLAIDAFPLLRKKQKSSYRKSYAPKVLVIVPCKGVDITLEQNLNSFTKQDYSNFDIIAVVDSKDDPAVRYINRAGIKTIISNSRLGRGSGKVKALLTAFGRFKNYEVYVIADSDALVGSAWLRDLVMPLSDAKIGISTTYPKFKPIGGLASKFKFVWAFVGEGLLENRSTRFAWGGSMAFRKDLIDKHLIGLMKDSQYSVSDDICITKAALAKGLGIEYVKEAQPVVNTDDSFSRFFEWSNRQTTFTLLGYRRNLYYGIAFYSAEILLVISAVAFSYYISIAFLILLLHLLRSEIKTYRRAGNRDPVIALIVFILPAIYLLNLILARGTKQITWRGSEYKLSF